MAEWLDRRLKRIFLLRWQRYSYFFGGCQSWLFPATPSKPCQLSTVGHQKVFAATLCFSPGLTLAIFWHFYNFYACQCLFCFTTFHKFPHSQLTQFSLAFPPFFFIHFSFLSHRNLNLFLARVIL